MSIILPRVHRTPDIWVVMEQHRTGFQMLTPRAKRWAARYKEADSEDEFEKMIWVPTAVGSQIMEDLSNETGLNILLDDWEEPISD